MCLLLAQRVCRSGLGRGDLDPCSEGASNFAPHLECGPGHLQGLGGFDWSDRGLAQPPISSGAPVRQLGQSGGRSYVILRLKKKAVP